jgi:hypothetical protein
VVESLGFGSRIVRRVVDMGLFSKKERTAEEIDQSIEMKKLEREEVTTESEIQERKAVISELKSKYGGGWQRILGINGGSPIATLRSFLSGAKKGMFSEASKVSNGSKPLSGGMDLSRLRGSGKDTSSTKLTGSGSGTAIGRVSTGGSGGGVTKA